MRALRTFWVRLTGLVARERVEHEISAELDSHLEFHIADNLRAGMAPEEARRAAILKLGGLSAVKEAYRDRSTLPVLENLILDLRFAMRQLARNAGFAATSVVVLSLGICVASAIFSFVDAALLKPLPYLNPAALVAVDESSAMFPRNNLSYFDYLDWKKLNRVFASLDVYAGSAYLMKTAEGVEPVMAGRVSDGFFGTLGVKAMLGRTFRTGDDLPNAPQTVVVTYGFWQKQFGGKRDVIGTPIVMSGQEYTIIGVLPPTFQFAPSGNAQIWTPLNPVGGCDTRRSCHDLDGIARLKQGISIQAALAELKIIAKQLERQYPDSNRGQGASVEPLSEIVVGKVRPVLLTLMLGALLLLLIAVVNILSLLLVRTESRRHEIAVRTSLGASRRRLAMQFLAEGAVLLAVSAAIGLAGTQAATSLLLKLIPTDMRAFTPFLDGIGINLRVTGFALLVAGLATLCFAVAPLMLTSRSDPHGEMARGGRWSAGFAWRRLGSKLVVVELGTAAVLLIGAGLLGKSLLEMLKLDVGFQPDHLAAITVAAADPKYAKDTQQIALARRIVAELTAEPGVRSVALTSSMPVMCNCNTDWIRVAGKSFDGRHEDVLERDITPQFFRTLGATLVRGRYFNDSDDGSHPKVVIVNQAFARKYFPGENPIGRQIGDLSLTPNSIRTIVGLVQDVREGSLEDDLWPAEYEPFDQSPDSYFSVVVRSQQDEHALLPRLRAAIRRNDPEIGTSGETSVNDQIRNSLPAYLHRSSSWLVGGFAGCALILSVVGLYGVVTYSVSRRTREIGVRMALGANKATVCWLFLREAGGLVAIGLAGGVLTSMALSKLVRQLLFNVQPWDGGTLIGVSVLLGTAAVLATFAPVRRAAHVNPIDALRVE